MKKQRKNKKIEYLRVLSLIGVFAYHLGILKGGYLAVCSFFVLSGYFSCLSLSKRKGGLARYYISRLLKTYIPLLVCVFVSTALISLFRISYVNMKPEGASVLLGYNNFWQISANQDYFTRTSSSPFLHMWYIAILLQYDLIYPLLFTAFRKIEEKSSPYISWIVLVVAIIGSFAFFSVRIHHGELMKAYYGSLERLFSFLAGVLLCKMHLSRIYLTSKKPQIEKILFLGELLVLFVFYVFDWSAAMPLGMALTTLLSLRVIAHSISLGKERWEADSYVMMLSSFSYEIYLYQYPILYMLLESRFPSLIQKILTVILTFVMAVILHNALDMNRILKKRIFNIVLCILVALTSIFGAYRFIIEKDHSKEMEELKEKLSENEKLIEERNKEYMNALNSEEAAYEELLKGSENKEEAVRQMLLKTPVVGIGDSLLVNAVDTLYDMFPIGYFDGMVSRDLYTGEEILQSMKDEGTLSDTILLCLSTNGDYIESRNEKLMEIVDGRQVFWIDAVGADDPEFNQRFESFAQNYDNLHIIHWEEASRGHSDWFWYDGVHVTGDGVDAFCDLIYESIYSYYLSQYEAMFEEAKAKSEAAINQRIAFYGDGVLIDAYDHLSKVFDQAIYNTENDYDPDTLYEDLKKRNEEGRLEKRIIFLFEDMRQSDYEKVLSECKGHRVIIADLNGTLRFKDPDVTVIDFDKLIKENDAYRGLEKGKLSAQGYEVLATLLKQVAEKQQ